ncbi:mechanosensitive ion channel family protein [Adhaeretor mobilis]|uniref:Small-conductance mechanosensitive channel n=1 Tax=Adhaeretor mobilis TaxID=1930276 RepID=A0A517MRD9_9BACT|nr:mechanosensitive ion channel family protein [Adhaeretor mobilis]QDS97451.1 Small-conductance mechanosensitive channel [Adhaeretor mobilis]
MNFPLLAQAVGKVAGETAEKAEQSTSADVVRNKMLEHVHKLQFTAMNSEEWISAAEYYGLRAAFVLVLMVLAWTLSSWASSLVRTAMRRVKFDETLTKFLAKLVRWIILLLAGLTCLSYFGVETTSFAAVIGAAGLAIGLAFQGTLSNFAAGAMLLIFRPYKVGDVVNVAGNIGKVFEIELFTTSIDTFDNRRFIIPNSEIFGATIENITFHPRRRAEVAVGTDYAADLDHTREVLEAAVRRVPEVLADPEPEVVLQELGGSSVNWSVRGWARNDDFSKTKQGITRAVKLALDEAQISIPFPQMDVHLETPNV